MRKAPEQASISDLHRITGYDREVISQKLTAAGLTFEKHNRGAHLYDKNTALAVLLGDGTAAVAVGDAKQRKQLAEAEKAELIVDQLKGRLVSADEMRKAAAELVKTMYQRIVRVEPSVIASKCVGLDAIGIETAIRDAMSQIFDELRNDLSGFMEVEEEADEPDGNP